jgi:hypothetical protein
MENWQHLLVYLTVAIALGYLLRKFVWPAFAKPDRDGGGKGCGNSDCGCG